MPKIADASGRQPSLYLARAWPYLRSFVVQSIGLLGVGSFIYGFLLIYPPAAWIVGGALVVVWTMLKMRSDDEEEA